MSSTNTTVSIDTVPSPDSADMPRLYEERETQNAGIGSFALKHIPAGTRILCESHILSLPKNAGPVDLLRSLKILAPEQGTAFWGLAGTDYTKSGNEELIAEASNELRNTYDGEEDFEDVRDRMVEGWEKYSTNRFGTGILGQGTWINNSVFEKASRLNHSCSPNVFHRFSVTLRRLTIHALRPILAGEEIFTSYIDIIPPSASRRETFRNWGFACICASCQFGTHDIERAALEQKMKVLADKGFPDTRMGHEAALLAQIIALMMVIGLNESDTTGDVYEAAAHASLDAIVGDVAQARQYAVLAREVHRICLGEDSVDFERVSALIDTIDASIMPPKAEQGR